MIINMKFIVLIMVFLLFSCREEEKLSNDSYDKIILVNVKDCSSIENNDIEMDSIIFFGDSIKYISYYEKVVKVGDREIVEGVERLGDTTMYFEDKQLNQILDNFDYDLFFQSESLVRNEESGDDFFIIIEKDGMTNGMCYNDNNLNPWIDNLLKYVDSLYVYDFKKVRWEM